MQLGIVKVVDQGGAAAAGLEGGFHHFLLEKGRKLAEENLLWRIGVAAILIPL
jgi:hypothetical protein